MARANTDLMFRPLGNNVEIAEDGDYFVLRMRRSADVVAKAAPSKSGKTRLLATTGGLVLADMAGSGMRIAVNFTAPLGTG